jgi:hypothetical protein
MPIVYLPEHAMIRGDGENRHGEDGCLNDGRRRSPAGADEQDRLKLRQIPNPLIP